MKLNRAWPTKKADDADEQKKIIKVDARVWPKSVTNIVDQTVERSLDQLLKESFPEEILEDPAKIESMETDRKEVAKKMFADPLSNVWIAIGILALITFISLNSLYQKISTLESWLHGRMLSSH